ncbi:MAG TPA: hypothetical protein VHW24_17250 [Bryobacteraceae bacterium]|nr:hypothetical protein [Bryobacteraceae bacterium]
MKITRRRLAVALAAPALSAQTTPPQSADPMEAAKARIKANTEALAKQSVPMSTEPAFSFRA